MYVAVGGGGMSVDSVLDDAIAVEHTAGWLEPDCFIQSHTVKTLT